MQYRLQCFAHRWGLQLHPGRQTKAGMATKVVRINRRNALNPKLVKLWFQLMKAHQNVHYDQLIHHYMTATADKRKKFQPPRTKEEKQKVGCLRLLPALDLTKDLVSSIAHVFHR